MSMTHEKLMEAITASDIPFASILDAFHARESQAEHARRARIIAQAREAHAEEGECEVDDNAVLSESDEGAYVMAWVWVPGPACRIIAIQRGLPDIPPGKVRAIATEGGKRGRDIERRAYLIDESAAPRVGDDIDSFIHERQE